MQHANLDLNFEYDEYLDWLDEQGMDLIKEFIEWFLKIMNLGNSLIEKQIDEKDIKNANQNNHRPNRPLFRLCPLPLEVGRPRLPTIGLLSIPNIQSSCALLGFPPRRYLARQYLRPYLHTGI